MHVYFPNNLRTPDSRGKRIKIKSLSAVEKDLANDRLNGELASTQLRFILHKRQMTNDVREMILEGRYAL
jgi:hypothetical protein